MSTAVMNRTMTVNTTNVKKQGVAERLKKYILNSAVYLGVNAAMASADVTGAIQMVKDSNCQFKVTNKQYKKGDCTLDVNSEKYSHLFILAVFAILFWCHANIFFEDFAKVTWTVKSTHISNVNDFNFWILH